MQLGVEWLENTVDILVDILDKIITGFGTVSQ